MPALASAGFSNGANFTYLLWAERPEVFAAFAPVASAGGYGHHHYHKVHVHHYSSHYVYVPACKWVHYHDHYGHSHYKRVCH